MEKEVVVKFEEQTYKEYLKLQEAVREGKQSRSKPTYEQLLDSIHRAIERLASNPFCGDLIPKNYVNNKIIQKYSTNKVFRLELVGYWRLLYTVVGEEAIIIALIMDFMSHKEYDKLFGYKKN